MVDKSHLHNVCKGILLNKADNCAHRESSKRIRVAFNRFYWRLRDASVGTDKISRLLKDIIILIIKVIHTLYVTVKSINTKINRILKRYDERLVTFRFSVAICHLNLLPWPVSAIMGFRMGS